MTAFHFFGGKGGVGKTTLSAAAAVRAADEGERVLLVSTDPAHSTMDAVGAKKHRRLTAVELDADAALDRWLAERKRGLHTIAERGTYLDDEDIDRFLGLSLPGVDELVGLIELSRLARDEPRDRVIVDTAPTGHTLRLMEMPRTLRTIAAVLDDMHAKHRLLGESLGGRYRPDFADALIAEIEEEAQAARAMVEKARFTWVLLPEELSLAEAEDGVAALTAMGLQVETVVMNRVWPRPDRPCPLCTPRTLAESRVIARARFDRLLFVPAKDEEPRGLDDLRAIAASVSDRPPAPAHGIAPRPARRGHFRFEAKQRLLLFGGKGGVGKTTSAAAAAIALAEAKPDARVLVLSTDPAHSLGDALAMPLSDEPTPVLRNLFARELDAPRAFALERDRYRQAVDDLFASITRGFDAAYDRAVIKDLIELAPPGIDELFAILSLIDALFGKKPYDTVVVDTAPSGHTLRLLALPESALEWVHALLAILLKYRKVIGLGELAHDLLTLSRRLKRLSELLRDPEQSAFVPVTRAAALPRLETTRLLASLDEMRIARGPLIVNAVTEPACRRCQRAADDEAREIRALPVRGMLLAPAVFPPPRGVAALRAWIRGWRPA